MVSRRDFIKKAGAVPLIGLTAGVTGALLAPGPVEASEVVQDLADINNGGWCEASSYIPGWETYWPIAKPTNTRGWYSGACWASQRRPTSIQPDWLVIHLGGGIPNISRVCIYSVQNNYNNPDPYPPDVTAGTYPHANLFAIKDFTVEAWDGSAWQIVATIRGNESAKRVLDFTTPVRTSKFRLQITDIQPYTNYTLVAGFEAWGTTQYHDLTDQYNVLSTSALGTTGQMVTYNGLSAANAAATAQQTANASKYSAGLLPTLSVVAATVPALYDRTHFRAMELTEEQRGSGYVDTSGVVFNVDTGGQFSNEQVAHVFDTMSYSDMVSANQQLLGGLVAPGLGLILEEILLGMGGGEAIALGGAFLGIGVVGVGIVTGLAYGIFNPPPSYPNIIPNAEGGFMLYHPFGN